MEKIICYTDGGARGNPGPAGAGALILDDKGNTIAEASEFLGNSTNNYAEYAAVILCLRTIKKHLGKKTLETEVEVRMDSELVARQLLHEYQIKEPSLVPQFIEIHNMRVKDFPHIHFVHVEREKNKEADRLANEAMNRGR